MIDQERTKSTAESEQNSGHSVAMSAASAPSKAPCADERRSTGASTPAGKHVTAGS